MIKMRDVIVTHYFENKVMDVTTSDGITYMMSLKKLSCQCILSSHKL